MFFWDNALSSSARNPDVSSRRGDTSGRHKHSCNGAGEYTGDRKQRKGQVEAKTIEKREPAAQGTAQARG